MTAGGTECSCVGHEPQIAEGADLQREAEAVRATPLSSHLGQVAFREREDTRPRSSGGTSEGNRLRRSRSVSVRKLPGMLQPGDPPPSLVVYCRFSSAR